MNDFIVKKLYQIHRIQTCTFKILSYHISVAINFNKVLYICTTLGDVMVLIRTAYVHLQCALQIFVLIVTKGVI